MQPRFYSYSLSSLSVERFLKVAMMLLVVCFASGASAQDQAASEDSATMKEKALQAWASIKDYAHDKQEDLAVETSDLLAAADERITALEAKAEEKWGSLSEASKEQWQQSMTALKEKRTQAGELWTELKASSAETWDTTKEKFQDVYHGLVEDYHTLFDEVNAEPKS